MHRLLHVLEILGLVFGLVFEEPKMGPKSLVALACTCRTFKDTALDILWRTVPNFAPLIQCLVPSSAWELREAGFSLTLKRPVILSDWERLKIYTPRIRCLGFGRKGYIRISPDIASTLKQCGVLPLPNLRVYRCEVSPFAGSLAFFGPNLLELEVVFGGSAHFPGLLVNSLKTSSPSLRKMTIESRRNAPSSDLPNSVGNIIACLNRLEVLFIVNFNLPDDVLRMLSSSHIRGLKSDNTSGDFLRCLPSCGPFFPELEKFLFRTGDLSECCDLISQLTPKSLQCISVAYDHRIAELPLVEHRVREFFRALELHCASTVLTAIALGQINPSFRYGNQQDPFYTMDTFEPLLSFRNLRALDLFFYEFKFDLRDSSIERMTTAWPQMFSFRLLAAQSSITFEGLLPMAKNWPQLEDLSLTFDTRKISNDIPLLKPGAGLCCPRLQSIDVGYSILYKENPEPRGIAAFLTAIFPNLRQIDHRDNTGNWKAVSSAVKATMKVRKQE